ncbi:MAG TPA: NAD(P)H-dependent oxidoreductase [Gemmatimonadaceae bacterium]|jgi:NAD(P)H-dependent FMN reductase|nr:NAD(P)H-dependent oxidoreductase [Gemmatimonadaceae bacterium]
MTTQIRDVRVLVLGASLSSTSLNNRLASLAAALVKDKGGTPDLTTIDAFDCPFYDRDVEVETGPPAGAQRFCERLQAADALMIASPEYNASMPAAIKNLIDWLSRFRPQPLNGKQALLLSASPSMVGGNRGLWALRIPLEHLGTRVYPDMFSLAQAHQAFADSGRLTDDALQERLERTLGCFLELVEAAKHYKHLKKVWVEFLGERPDAATDRVEESEVAA